MFLPFFLIEDNPLMSLPPPANDDAASGNWWWPIAMWALPIIATGVSTWLARRATQREKELDLRHQQESEKTTLRIAQLETDAQQRDKVFEMLQKQVTAATEQRNHDMEESRKLREELRTARADLRGAHSELAAREGTIATLRKEIATLRSRVRELEQKL